MSHIKDINDFRRKKQNFFNCLDFINFLSFPCNEVENEAFI